MRIARIVILATAAQALGCSTTLTGWGRIEAIDDLRRAEAARDERELRAQHAKFLQARWGFRREPVAYARIQPGPHDSRDELGEWDP